MCHKHSAWRPTAAFDACGSERTMELLKAFPSLNRYLHAATSIPFCMICYLGVLGNAVLGDPVDPRHRICTLSALGVAVQSRTFVLVHGASQQLMDHWRHLVPLSSAVLVAVLQELSQERSGHGRGA